MSSSTHSFDKDIPSTSSVTDHGEYITLGNQKFRKDELQTAFGGTLVAERFAPYPKHEFGNASALGLISFGLTTFTLGLYYAGAMGVSIPNIVVGLTFFYGGACQFLAGVWELVIGNTFAGTAFASYGPFWMSFGAIFVKSFGIQAAYGDDAVMLSNAIGFFCLGWAVFTFMMLLFTLKTTVMFFGLFLTLDLAFILLAVGNFKQDNNIIVAGGVFCVITSCCGFWNAFAGVATKENSYITCRALPLPVFGKQE